MSSLLLKGLSSDVKKRLQERAVLNRRSMSQEAMFILESELRMIPRQVWHEPLKPLKPISNAGVLKAIRAGRK